MHVYPLPDKISTKFQRQHLCFWGPAFHWDLWEYHATNPEVKNPRWRPLNFKYIYIRSQTSYQRNSIGYTYNFGVQLSIGTHGNTMRPNRKWTNSRWWPLNFKYIYLRSQARYQRNSNGYIYVFGVQLSIGTHGNTMRPSRE